MAMLALGLVAFIIGLICIRLPMEIPWQFQAMISVLIKLFLQMKQKLQMVLFQQNTSILGIFVGREILALKAPMSWFTDAETGKLSL